MSCYLCKCDDYTTRPGNVRDNSDLKVLECSNCGLVYLASFEHIKSGHYEESGMHDELPDIDSWLIETQIDDERRYQFMKEKMMNKSVLDFGCGVGGFLELAKKSSSQVAGIELEKALRNSFDKRKLDVFPDIQTAVDNRGKWDLITAFHVVEHLVDPKATLTKLSSLLTADGEIIIEVPSSEDALLTIYNCESFQNFTYWSQHLFLFNIKTLAELIKQAGLKLNWIKHVQRYPLSNHLYWLSNGKPGGHQKWGYMNNHQLNIEYESLLAALGKTDTLIAGISH